MAEPLPSNGNGNGNGKASWVGNLITGAAVLTVMLALGAAVRDGDIRDAQRTAEVVHSLNIRFAQLDYERGGWDKAISALETKVIELDTTLQREMRLLNDTTMTAVDGIDRRLQGEIRTWVEDFGRQASELRESSRGNRDMIHGVREELARIGAKP